MDEPRFDALSRWISPRLPRRSLIGLLSALALGGETPYGAVAKKQRGAKRRARQKRHDRKPVLQSLVPDVQSEIVGGIVVSQGTHDFATFVEISLGNNRIAGCTGSLITPRHVLTAAHCVVDDLDQTLHPSQFLTAIGRASIVGVPTANIRSVAAVFKHPDYTRATFRNDVAVLQLQSDVPATIARPVAVVGSNDTRFDSPGQVATVAGWGRTSGGGPASAQLLQAPLAVMSDAACAQLILSTQPDVHLCASNPSASGCNGDSGGPFFVTIAAASEPRGMAMERGGVVGAEKKKRKKRRKRGKNQDPAPVPVPPPPASPPVSPPPLAGVALQIGVVSFGYQTCPPGGVNVFTQLSAPAVRGFIAEVAGV